MAEFVKSLDADSPITPADVEIAEYKFVDGAAGTLSVQARLIHEDGDHAEASKENIGDGKALEQQLQKDLGLNTMPELGIVTTTGKIPEDEVMKKPRAPGILPRLFFSFVSCLRRAVASRETYMSLGR